MKKYFFVFLLLIFGSNSIAQVDIMTGMGITFQSTPSLTDYINNTVPEGEELADYSSAINFLFGADFTLNPTFDIGFEYEHKIFSYNTSFSGLGTYDISYLTYSPSILAYYTIPGAGYKFKFGGGAGYRYVSVDEQLPTSNIVETYTASGFGLLLKAQAHTLLGGNFHAYIGADIRYDVIGEPSNDNGVLGTSAYNESIDFNTLGVGVKLGVSYFIR